MPSIIEVDTIKNKTGTQNTVLSTDGSGNNTLNANTIKDGSATKTLATLSSSAVTLHSDVSFPAGHVIQGGIIDIPATNVNCNHGGTGDAAGGVAVTHSGGGSILGATQITPKSNSSKFIFILGIHVDSNLGGGMPTKFAVWGGSSNTLIIETYWHTRYHNTEPLPHVGTGFLNNTDGSAFNVKIRGYTTIGTLMRVGQLGSGSAVVPQSNTTSSLVFYEVQT